MFVAHWLGSIRKSRAWEYKNTVCTGDGSKVFNAESERRRVAHEHALWDCCCSEKKLPPYIYIRMSFVVLIRRAAEQKQNSSPFRIRMFMGNNYASWSYSAGGHRGSNSIRASLGGSQVEGRGVAVHASLGGGVLSMDRLILGHLLWEDFAELRDKKALEFLQ